MFKDPIALDAWKKLNHFYEQKGKHLNLIKEFEKDPERAKRFSLKVNLPDGSFLFLDYSKNLVDDEIMKTLFSLLEENDFYKYRESLFQGDTINLTENRPVLHMALRSHSKSVMNYKEKMPNIYENIQKELIKVKNITEKVHNGHWVGYTGKAITHIVNIGIGGSDLGPRMVVTALEPFANTRMKSLFVSNVDGYDIDNVVSQCPHETTLFIIVSKTFTTQETLTNAMSARAWFMRASEQKGQIGKHFIAVSTNLEAVLAFGIPADDDHVFSFWDFVGGRYSVWSTVGLSVSLSIGYPHFEAFLQGAATMDDHFLTAENSENAPIVMALLGVWYNNFHKAETQAILPYEQALILFPKYLQQLEMESNGKNVTRNGEWIKNNWETGQIIWGEPGTNGQHAFYQLLHQGTKLIPADFLGGLGAYHLNQGDAAAANKESNPLTAINQQKHHEMLLSNMLAQAEALMNGTAQRSTKDTTSLPVFRQFEGNRPSTTILYGPCMSPMILGALIALYEHKVFVQGHIWNIHSFDQWGVELGKKLASVLLPEISPSLSDGGTNPSDVAHQAAPRGDDGHDASTLQLLNLIRSGAS